MALRMLFSAPFYLVIAISARRAYEQPIRGSTLALTALFGTFAFYFAAAFDLYGLQYISASLERLILYTYPTLVVILSIVFLGTKITRSLIVCIAVIYLGLVVVFIKDTGTHDNITTVATQIC